MAKGGWRSTPSTVTVAARGGHLPPLAKLGSASRRALLARAARAARVPRAPRSPRASPLAAHAPARIARRRVHIRARATHTYTLHAAALYGTAPCSQGLTTRVRVLVTSRYRPPRGASLSSLVSPLTITRDADTQCLRTHTASLHEGQRTWDWWSELRTRMHDTCARARARLHSAHAHGLRVYAPTHWLTGSGA